MNTTTNTHIVVANLNGKHNQRNTLDGELKLKDIQIERLRLDLVHREGSMENLKKENELLLQLQADKKAEMNTERVIFFDNAFKFLLEG